MRKSISLQDEPEMDCPNQATQRSHDIILSYLYIAFCLINTILSVRRQKPFEISKDPSIAQSAS
jgi:hypothetical protein